MAIIKFCQTVLSYENGKTCDFKTKPQQLNYFDNLSDDYVLEENVKVDGFIDTITVKRNINDIKRYDYIMVYREDDYNRKDCYFYFIVGSTFNTKSTTTLHLKLDVIQTYFFDFFVGESFVDRCHVPRWTSEGLPTNNNIDEGLEYGPTIIDKIEKVKDLKGNYIICSTSPLGVMEKGGGSDGGDSGIEGGGGSPADGYASNKMIRFLKGWEGFASKEYYDSGGVLTWGYGVTKINEPDYWEKLKPSPCSEKTASIVLIELIHNRYGKPLANRMKADGVDLTSLPPHKFDAFLDLCYNGGLGSVTSSPMYHKFLANPNGKDVADGWEDWYIRDDKGNVLQGLINRRKQEKNMFLSGTYEMRPIQNLTDGGYVQGDGYFPSTDTDSRADKIVNYARELIGKPYRWGGNYPPLGTSDGTDCSGLCQWAYYKAGIKITRTTYTQVKEGISVSKDNIKKADLIFLRFNSNGEPEHVVLYSGLKDGKHYCVEAPRTGLNIRERVIDLNGDIKIRRLLK